MDQVWRVTQGEPGVPIYYGSTGDAFEVVVHANSAEDAIEVVREMGSAPGTVNLLAQPAYEAEDSLGADEEG